MTNQNSTETSQEPTDPPSLILSKLDVASRQLETAITLYFQEADPVSIHTLASAAHEIIETLNAKNVGKPTIRQQSIGQKEYARQRLPDSSGRTASGVSTSRTDAGRVATA